jgi:hypothetical protein
MLIDKNVQQAKVKRFIGDSQISNLKTDTSQKMERLAQTDMKFMKLQ